MVQSVKSDVTIIFNIWKRPYFEEQLEAIFSQTVQPDFFWVNQNEHHVDIDDIIRKRPVLKKVHADVDLKYFYRFSLASYCQTTYVWILDDDVIPSRYWLEKCMAYCNDVNAIVCSSGRIIPPQNYFPEKVPDQPYLKKYFIGDGHNSPQNICMQTTPVDFGCNSWFFKRDWLKHFWATWPYTFQTGEDIHFSASCRMAKGISTIVPEQTDSAFCGNLKRAYGFDDYASFKRKDFLDNRSQVIKYWVEEQGWRPLQW